MNTIDIAAQSTAQPRSPAKGAANDPELRKAFNDFVGETFYSQMLHAMRKSVGTPAYFNGGRAEEVFNGQLDQMLATKLAASSGDKLADSMYALFTAGRR